MLSNENLSMSNNKFLQEIHEQPKVLRETLQFYVTGEGENQIRKIVEKWKAGDFTRLIFTGMGSSYFVSNAVVNILNQSGIYAESINAGELLHYRFPVLNANTMLVCVSQSGESFEVVKILEKLPAAVNCIGICNEADSTLARRAGTVLLCKAGREEMTSTKTYVSTYLVAIILALALSDQWGPERISEIKAMIEGIETIIFHPEQYLSPAMDLIRDAAYIQITGRGPSIAAVQQGALMFMEGARHPASALFSGEFRHGPMEVVKTGFRAIIIAPDGITYEQNLSLAYDILKFGGKVILISNRKILHPDDRIILITVPAKAEYLFSIPAIIPLQFIVNQWATEKGHTPGDFTRGAKVTTIE